MKLFVIDHSKPAEKPDVTGYTAIVVNGITVYFRSTNGGTLDIPNVVVDVKP